MSYKAVWRDILTDTGSCCSLGRELRLFHMGCVRVFGSNFCPHSISCRVPVQIPCAGPRLQGFIPQISNQCVVQDSHGKHPSFSTSYGVKGSFAKISRPMVRRLWRNLKNSHNHGKDLTPGITKSKKSSFQSSYYLSLRELQFFCDTIPGALQG